jgi:ATP-dependent DNA helicase DinG
MFPGVIRARDVLGPGSPLSRSLAGWEHRDGQLAMAEEVERALEEEHHLFVEAGTGTGKTLAYLVPAVLSGRKIVISTATRALQEQIFVKDLPIVAEALAVHGVPLRAALMKGLSNYVCLRRLGEARGSGERGLDGAIERIADWAQKTESGDRAELADLPEDSEVWRAVASSTDTRIGAGCDHFEACFVTRMRREAEDAQIVVVNHHLLLADLALRRGKRGAYASVLPAYDAVVFDEAHQVEDVATDFFGVRVSSARVESLLRDAEHSLASVNALEALKNGPVRLTLETAREASRAFFGQFLIDSRPASVDSRRVLSDADVTPLVRAAHGALDVRLEALDAIARARPDEALQLIARRTSDLRSELAGILAGVGASEDGEVSDLVRWIELRSRSVSLGASPVDVGSTLRTSLFDRVPTVVCTSATLATANSCHFAKARLGAPPESVELIVASPFDFASRAALYLPDDLPEPADPLFEDAAADRIAELVKMTDGGAFVLCTSTRAMRSLSARLRRRVDFPLMVQGERPKHLLLSRFRASGRALLVATMSFWEGVDVPGWALRLVVLDKIPFAPPNDPVIAARCAAIDQNGGNGFTQYSVPSAAMTLKQGFGRLIRTQRDAGIVAILDKRIVRKGYGRALLSGLPPARRARTFAELKAFWDAIALERLAVVPSPSSIGESPRVEDPASLV